MGILDKIRGLSWVVGSRKGEKAVKDGRFEDALVHLDESIALNPKDAYAYFYRGLAHGGLGNLNAAIRDLNTAKKFGPQDSALLTNLGTCYLRKGQFAAALKEYKKALKINPKDASALLNVGIVYAKQAETAPPRSEPRLIARALDSLDKAIISDPNLPEAYHERALLLTDKGRLPEAIKDLTQAINLDKSYTEAYDDRESLYRRLGKSEKVGDGPIHPSGVGPRILAEAPPDPYAIPYSSRSTRFSTFPNGLRGSESTKITDSGFLKLASWPRQCSIISASVGLSPGL